MTKGEWLARQKRIARVSSFVFALSALFFILVCVASIRLLKVDAIVSDTAPLAAFSWTLYPPALATLFLSILTAPLAIRVRYGVSRWTLTVGASIGLAYSLFLNWAAVSIGQPPAAAGAAAVFGLALTLVVVRAALGVLGKVPETWRDPSKRVETESG